MNSSDTQTPLAKSATKVLSHPIVLAPILRAGLGMCEGILRVVPEAAVAHLGLYRDPKTLRPVTYYSRMPGNLADARVMLLDPMLATGYSACGAVSILKKSGGTMIQFLCVLSCEAGIQQLQREHPDVTIMTAAVDPELNSAGYIVPGLGDAGDRYFATE